MESFELGYIEISSRPTLITKEILKKKDNSLNQNGTSYDIQYQHTLMTDVLFLKYSSQLHKCGF